VRSLCLLELFIHKPRKCLAVLPCSGFGFWSKGNDLGSARCQENCSKSFECKKDTIERNPNFTCTPNYGRFQLPKLHSLALNFCEIRTPTNYQHKPTPRNCENDEPRHALAFCQPGQPFEQNSNLMRAMAFPDDDLFLSKRDIKSRLY
jgi:hypothetical protein